MKLPHDSFPKVLLFQSMDPLTFNLLTPFNVHSYGYIVFGRKSYKRFYQRLNDTLLIGLGHGSLSGISQEKVEYC